MIAATIKDMKGWEQDIVLLNQTYLVALLDVDSHDIFLLKTIVRGREDEGMSIYEMEGQKKYGQLNWIQVNNEQWNHKWPQTTMKSFFSYKK